jgi:hypothetical protein
MVLIVAQQRVCGEPSIRSGDQSIALAAVRVQCTAAPRSSNSLGSGMEGISWPLHFFRLSLDGLHAARDIFKTDQEFVLTESHPRGTHLMSDVGDGLLEFSNANLSRILRHHGSSAGANFAYITLFQLPRRRTLNASLNERVLIGERTKTGFKKGAGQG